ncbi:hypothetical protein CLBKND_03194 [Methylorubrum aminovorans]
MTTKLLLVEDDATFREVVIQIISELGPDVSLQIAKSRDSATGILSDESFDLIILDLKLPAVDDSLDTTVDHGRYIFQSLRLTSPGTPVLILTGSPAESFISSFLSYSTNIDIWGDGNASTVSFLKKSDVDRLPEMLTSIVNSVRAVIDVELKIRDANLTWEHSRLLKIFVRRSGGVIAEVNKVGGGLSGSDVYRASVYDNRGAIIHHAIIKVGSHEMVEKEAVAYKTFVSRLEEKATVRFIEDVKFGGGKSAAVAYRLASGYDFNMFDLARRRPESAPKVVERLATLLSPWKSDNSQTRVTIGDVRRRLLHNDKAEAIFKKYGLDWASDLERRQLQVRYVCCHGDLHGANILVNDNDEPIIIDYGDIDHGPSCLDWITLELSLLFHKDGCARSTVWPTDAACQRWPEAEGFAADGDFTRFVLTCRSVANDSCAGNRELAATTYAYLLRQLAYEDTDKSRVLAIISSVKSMIENT